MINETRLDPLELTGQTDNHVFQPEELQVPLHPQAFPPFLRMQEAAAKDGIEIKPISGFRSFQKQSGIWNAKWKGERTLHDADGKKIDHAGLDPVRLMRTILIWSALPGASRHHWGTDIDVIDAAARPPGYEVQLLPREYAPGGPFARLSKWLTENMGRFGFFLPYKVYQGGVSTEPWHISYAPVSVPALRQMTVDVLREAIERSHLLGKKEILDALPNLYTTYVTNITPPGDDCQV